MMRPCDDLIGGPCPICNKPDAPECPGMNATHADGALRCDECDPDPVPSPTDQQGAA